MVETDRCALLIWTSKGRPMGLNAWRDEGSCISKGSRLGKRRLFSVLIASTILGVAGISIPGVGHAQQRAAGQAIAFDIPAQSLSSAVNAFIRATGWEVGFHSPSVVGKRSTAVSGTMTPAQALQTLLTGTGVSAQISGQSTAALVDGSVAVPAGVAVDGALVLDTIDVQGGNANASSGEGYMGTPDWVYETPSSVSVVSGEALQTSGARNVRDAISTAPGVYSGEGQGSFPTVSPNIRGVSDSGRVVVSIDGARQNAQDGGRYGGGLGGYGTAFVDSAFIREVDITKNPDATAGNAGSLGGRVNFRTVNAEDIILPGREWGVEVSGTAGTNAFDYQGSVIGSALVGDNLALTVGLSGAHLGDYEGGTHGEITTSNIYNMTGRESWSSLLKLEGDFGDVTTSLSWMHQQNNFGYSPTGSTVGSTFDARNDSVSARIAWDPESLLINTKATFWLNNSTSDETRVARYLGDMLVWPETYQERDLLSFGGTLENTSELETNYGPLTLNYGVEAFRDDASSHVMNDDIANDPRFASGYMQFNRPGQRDVASTFINGRWEPVDWVAVSGGVRYDWYRLNGDSTYYRYEPPVNFKAMCQISEYDHRYNQDPGSVAGLPPFLIAILQGRCGQSYDGTFYQEGSTIPGLSTPATYPATTVDIDRTDGAWLPSATVEFKPTDWLRPYVSYAHSFRPPTINEAFFSGGVSPITAIDTGGAPNVDLRPEKARTWEAGVNVIRDGIFTTEDTFRFKASAFHRTIEDYIVIGYLRVPDVTRDLLGFVNADGDTTMYGVELEGNYDAGSYWLGGAATWLETEWPETTQRFTNGSGTTTGEIFAYAGAVPPRFKVTIDAGVRLFDKNVALGARLNHVTPNLARYLDENGNLAETSDPYTTLDLHAAFKLGENAMLNLAVNNVTDQLYVPATGNYIAPGRTFLATMKANF